MVTVSGAPTTVPFVQSPESKKVYVTVPVGVTPLDAVSVVVS
jgi:hypothetical protein